MKRRGIISPWFAVLLVLFVCGCLAMVWWMQEMAK